MLVLENETLKSYNRRYLKLIKEVKDGQEPDEGLGKIRDADNLASLGEPNSPPSPIKKGSPLSAAKRFVEGLDLGAIN